MVIQSWCHQQYFVFMCVRACLTGGGSLESNALFLDPVRHKWKWTLLLCSKPQTPAPSFSSGLWVIGCSIICTEFQTSINPQEHITCNKHSFHQPNCDAAVNRSLRCGPVVFPERMIFMSILNNPNLIFQIVELPVHSYHPCNKYLFMGFTKWNDWTGILQKRKP